MSNSWEGEKMGYSEIFERVHALVADVEALPHNPEKEVLHMQLVRAETWAKRAEDYEKAAVEKPAEPTNG